jgi:phosphoglycerol transferase MdoB-like AlkP superfamily enzyme
MNSLIYADEQLGEFLKNAQKEEWYKNTLFVFVADHGHTSPIQSNPSDIDFFKIPLLFYGDVIKEEFKGKRNTVLASQADFAATLLYQMEISQEAYHWSRNLMNPNTKPYVLHTVAGGYGYRSKEGTYCYQMENDYVIKDSISEEGKRNSFALVNALYYDFLEQ